MTRLDVVGIGNALVDVLSHESEEFVVEHELEQRRDAAHRHRAAEQLYAAMSPATEISGGSAANTMVGIASFGGKAAFVGRVNDDQLGDVFGHDLRAAGVEYLTPPADGGEPTGRCLIVVTPDAERTLNTYLGASAKLGPDDLDDELVASAQVLYLEGYLWDEPEAKDAFRRAVRLAHDAGNRVAFTLSDAFCVDRHRDEFLELIEHEVDVLFANEAEITSLYQVDEFDDALQRVHDHCEIARAHAEREGRGDRDRATRCTSVDAAPGRRRSSTPPAPVTSTPPGSCTGSRTGTTSAPPGGSGALAAAEVISHLGAAPEGSLAELGAPAARDDARMKLPATAPATRRSTGRSPSSSTRRRSGECRPRLRARRVGAAARVDRADRGDLKIASAALKEMRHAFYVFAPYRAARKVAIFGSARTQPDDPLYEQTRELAAEVADRDWMVVTGAGPGIMEAGIEGAGPDNAFGVSIRLPFEAATSQFFDGDPKLINFRYFFTRKLEFVKESDGFVLLPGGFGTLDEAFELLTLLQTGKAQPAPVVLLDVPGGTYWQTGRSSSSEELVGTGYISGDDTCSCDHRRHRRRGRRDHAASTPTTTRCGSSTGASCSACSVAPTPDELARPERGLRRHRRARRDRDDRRIRAEIADDDHVDLAGSGSGSTGGTGRASGADRPPRTAIPASLTTPARRSLRIARPARALMARSMARRACKTLLSSASAWRRRRPRPREPVVGEVAQLLLDRPQPFDDLLGVSHGVAPPVLGQQFRRVADVEAGGTEVQAHPGFADTTSGSGAPAAGRMAATLRCADTAESSGCSAA